MQKNYSFFYLELKVDISPGNKKYSEKTLASKFQCGNIMNFDFRFFPKTPPSQFACKKFFF